MAPQFAPTIKAATIAILFICLGPAACTKKTPEQAAPKAQMEKVGSQPVTEVSKLSVGAQIVADVSVSLSENGMSNEQIKPMQAGAFSALGEAQPGLNLAALKLANAAKTNEAAPAIVQAMISAMKESSTGLSSDAAKIKIAGVVVGATFNSLRNKMSELSEAERKELPALLSASGIKPLSNSGISADGLSKGVGTIMSNVVSGIGDAGFKDEEKTEIFSKVASESVKSFKDAGVKSADTAVTLQALVKESVAAMPRAGLNESQMSELVNPFMLNAIGSVRDLGVRSSEQYQALMPEIFNGLVSGLGSVGIQKPERLGPIVKQAIGGALQGATQPGGLKASAYPELLQPALKGAIASLSTAGVKNTDFNSAAATFAGDSINMAQSLGLNDKDSLATFTRAASAGAIEGLGSFKMTGKMQTTELEKGINAIAKSTTSSMHTIATKAGLEDLAPLTRSLSEGMAQGLASAGWKRSEIETMTTPLSQGVELALQIKGVVQANIDAHKINAVAGAKSYLMELKIHCTAANGNWEEADETCVFPVSIPPQAAVKPSLDQEQKCLSIGGVIKYDHLAKWLCSAPLNNLAKSESECVTAGFSWVPGLEGYYCETVKSQILSCTAKPTESTCVADANCLWNKTICQNKSSLSCGAKVDQMSCQQSVGCLWDGANSLCKSAMMNKCDYATQGTCSAATGCSWENNACFNVGEKSCGSYTSSANCAAVTGCVFNNNICQNQAFLSCQSQVTKDSCTAKLGCSWTGSLCANAGTIACGVNTSSDLCAKTQGCSWNGSVCTNAALLACTAYNADSTCTASPGCTWDQTVCKNNTMLSCAGNASELSCLTSPGCLWSGSPAQCISAPNQVCTGSFGACAGIPGCVYDGKKTACANAANVSCEAGTSESLCGQNIGCVWKSGLSRCERLVAQNCSTENSSSLCSAKLGCIWKAALGTGTCVNAVAYGAGCSSYSADMCEKIPGCIYSVANSTCNIDASITPTTGPGTSASSVCSTINDRTSCEAKTASDKCYFDGISCMLKDPAPGCDYYKSATICLDKTCVWQPASPTACLTQVDCSAVGLAACPSTPGCSVSGPTCYNNLIENITGIIPPISNTVGSVKYFNAASGNISWSGWTGATEIKVCSASDCSGCGAAQLKTGSPATISGLTEGERYFCARGKNTVGYGLTAVSERVMVDKTSPGVPTLSNAIAQSASSIKVNLVPPTADPSLDYIEGFVCNSATCDANCTAMEIPKASNEYIFSGIAVGNHSVCLRSVDYALNRSDFSTTKSVTLSSTCNMGTCSTESGCFEDLGICYPISVGSPTAVAFSSAPLYSNNIYGSFTVGFAAPVSQVGLKEYQVALCNDSIDLAVNPYSGACRFVAPNVSKTNLSFTFDFSGASIAEGQYKAWVRTVDMKNNVGNWVGSGLLVIDQSPPITPTVSQISGLPNGATKHGLTLGFAGAFPIGVSSYEIKVLTTSPVTTLSTQIVTSPSTPWIYTPAADGIYTIEVKAKDLAGNFSDPLGRSYIYDTTAPTSDTIERGLNTASQISFDFENTEPNLTHTFKLCFKNEIDCSSCSTPAIEKNIISGSVTFQPPSLTTGYGFSGGMYKLCHKVSDVASNFSAWASLDTLGQISCAALNTTGNNDMVKVPPNADYGLANGFCVQKYLASVTGGQAQSIPSVSPYFVSAAPASGVTRIMELNSFCAAVGKNMHLLTNDEYMALAQAAYSQGNPNSTSLYPGLINQTEISTACEAHSDSFGQANDGATACVGVSTSGAYMRKKIIPMIIWDLGGNLWHIVDNFPSPPDLSSYPSSDLQVPLNSVIASSSYVLSPAKSFFPQSLNGNPANYALTNGFGAYLKHSMTYPSAPSEYILIRGGGFRSRPLLEAGVFSAKYIHKSDVSSDVNGGTHYPDLGFRCAFTPSPAVSGY